MQKLTFQPRHQTAIVICVGDGDSGPSTHELLQTLLSEFHNSKHWPFVIKHPDEFGATDALTFLIVSLVSKRPLLICCDLKVVYPLAGSCSRISKLVPPLLCKGS